MKARLFLIDGHALIFKMYYAFLRRPMINSKGEDTSILFGFTKYLLEMIHREEPTHLAVAFDPPGGTFRNEMYPQYKANRDETPQLVIDALEPLKELCKALDIPVLMMPGFEADDVIGSMAKQMKSPDTEIFMVTPDKDYFPALKPHSPALLKESQLTLPSGWSTGFFSPLCPRAAGASPQRTRFSNL